jgi:hypothetical protein
VLIPTLSGLADGARCLLLCAYCLLRTAFCLLPPSGARKTGTRC